MAIFSGIDLKRWRESQKISQADLAERISCDSSTIARYESGKLHPDPDVMYEICDTLGDVDKWTSWMRTEYPRSYGRMHPETVPYTLQGALMSLFTETKDVLAIEHSVMKDGADGRIDDPAVAEALRKEVTELIQCAQRVKSLIAKEG